MDVKGKSFGLTLSQIFMGFMDPSSLATVKMLLTHPTELLFQRPVEVFEKQTGLTGLSAQYVLPNGITAWMLQNIINELNWRKEKFNINLINPGIFLWKALTGRLEGDDWKQNLIELFENIKKLNPGLLGAMTFDTEHVSAGWLHLKRFN